MAGKTRNRMELRRQHDAVEPVNPMEDEADDLIEEIEDPEEAEKKAKKKPKAKAKAKVKAPAKSKAKTAKPPKASARMRIVWAVVSDTFKTVGTFEYSKKAEAEARAAELTAKGKGTHFVQRVKEPMPEDAPGLGASIPRPAPVPVAAKRAAPDAAAVSVEEDDDFDDDEEEEEIDDDDD